MKRSLELGWVVGMLVVSAGAWAEGTAAPAPAPASAPAKAKVKAAEAPSKPEDKPKAESKEKKPVVETAKKGGCGCAVGDLLCAMKCSAR
jgi:hypothetical protein